MSLVKRMISTSNSLAPLPLRLAVGAVMIGHGGQKLFGLFGGGGLKGTAQYMAGAVSEPGMLWAILAGGSEFFGGILILLGLFTRFGALTIVGTMVVATYVMHNSNETFTFFASKGGVELPFIMLMITLALLVTGGGAFSLDRVIQKN